MVVAPHVRGSPLPLLTPRSPAGYTAAFARQHDEAVLACLQELLANDGPPMWEVNATRRAQLPLQLGGLGLRSAETTRFAAHWASWADTLPTRDRRPGIVADLLRQAEALLVGITDWRHCGKCICGTARGALFATGGV